MAQTKTNTNSLNLKTTEAQRLFMLSSQMADFSEEILENRGVYNDEFIKGLTQSVDQVKKGKTFKIDSLAELV